MDMKATRFVPLNKNEVSNRDNDCTIKRIVYYGCYGYAVYVIYIIYLALKQFIDVDYPAGLVRTNASLSLTGGLMLA